MARRDLLFQLQKTLHVNNQGLAELLGVSTRTIIRGGGFILPKTYAKLAAAVYPHDPAFAAELANEAGQTLTSLGLESPTNRQRGPTPAHLADSVLCAAAEAMHAPPDAMRPALVAALERIVALGLTADEVLQGMTPPPTGGGASSA